jgi:putative FmdB family regulatory protein
MPIFEFKCKNCNYVFEELVMSSTDDSEMECPNCGTQSTEKLMSAFSSASSGADTYSSAGCGSSGFR